MSKSPATKGRENAEVGCIRGGNCRGCDSCRSQCTDRRRRRPYRQRRSCSRGRAGESPIPAPQAGGTRELTAQDVNAWLDGFMPYALGKGDIAGAVVVRGQGRPESSPTAASALPTSRSARRSIPRPDPVPARLGLQAVHLDRGDAAGRAGQARPRRRRQPVPRFQDSGLRGQAGHDAPDHDPHGRLRGAGQGPDRHRSRQRSRPTTSCSSAGCPSGSTRRARRRPIRTTRPRSPATSSSASRASRSTIMSSATSSRRWGCATRPSASRCRRSSSRSWRRAIRRRQASPSASRSSARRRPASLSSTGADMARFMIAHLNGGELDGRASSSPRRRS